MAVIRGAFLPPRDLACTTILQNEHSIVRQSAAGHHADRYGSDDQKAMIEGSITEKYRITFGLTSRAWLRRDPHGNPRGAGDPRWRLGVGSSTARRCGPPACMWRRIARYSPAPAAMTATRAASPACWCRRRARGVKVEEYMWTFNMPTDHPRVSFTDVFVPDDAAVRRNRPRVVAGAMLRA